jgi:hypothetical protein
MKKKQKNKKKTKGVSVKKNKKKAKGISVNKNN